MSEEVNFEERGRPTEKDLHDLKNWLQVVISSLEIRILKLEKGKNNGDKED